ncbi:hypothetical protein V8D89_002313 [Ganoderma adspersum]
MRFSVIIALALINCAAATYVPRAEAEGSSETEALVARHGHQYTGGACSHDSECASNCCGFNTGKCAGPFVALLKDGGCGHGESHAEHKLRRDLRY